jgi:AAA domain
MSTIEKLLDVPDVPEQQPLTEKEPLTARTIGGMRVAAPGEFDYLNLLVYGEAGVGKTRLAGSSVFIPEMCPVLVLDAEGGVLSLARDMRDVEVMRITSWERVPKIYDTLYDSNPYKTIVVDSLSELQKQSMRRIMQQVVQKDSDRDPEVAAVREWGKNSEQIRRLVAAFRDLPCNTIFTALTDESKDERTGTTRIRPGLPGKLKGEVAGYVDIVLYMYQKEVITSSKERETKTLVLTQGTERQVAKDRSGTLPLTLESPTMQTIYNYVKGQNG